MADKTKEIPDQLEKLNQVRSKLADRLEILEDSLDRILAQQKSTASTVENTSKEEYQSPLACDLDEDIHGLSLLVQKIDSLIERLQI